MKTEEKSKDEEQMRFLFENRIKLQSTARYLDENKISQRKFEYFTSKEFLKNYFIKWDALKRKFFLEKLVGKSWKQFQEMLEKE